MVIPERLTEKVFAIDLTEDVFDVIHGVRRSTVSDIKAFGIPASVIDLTTTAAKLGLNTSNEESELSGEPTREKNQLPFKIPSPVGIFREGWLW